MNVLYVFINNTATYSTKQKIHVDRTSWRKWPSLTDAIEKKYIQPSADKIQRKLRNRTKFSTNSHITRGDQKLLQLDILDWKTFQILYTSNTYISPILIWTKSGPGQCAYEMFGIKRRLQWCKVWPPRFNESSVRVHQIWVPPSKRAISATVY